MRAWVGAVGLSTVTILAVLLYRGSNMGSTWRGFNLPGGAHPADLENLLRRAVTQYRANIFRLQVADTWEHVNEWTPAEYEAWLAGRMDVVEVIADVAASLGKKIIIDMHMAIGGRPNGYDLIFTKRWARASFASHWRGIAERFRDHPGILGYDLMNEPAVRRVRPMMRTLLLAAKRIRAVDSSKKIIFTPKNGNPTKVRALSRYVSRMKEFGPIWITAHMYWPHNITHQGIPDANCNIKYPIGGKLYPTSRINKERLREVLQRLRSFQEQHNIRVFIGEFSCIRWSGFPVADNVLPYLNDVIEIFEEYSWQWTYHAFGSAGPWDLEYDRIPCPDRCNPHCLQSPSETDRSRLVKSFMNKN